MTGELSRNATIALDFEEEESYLLTVVAEDGGDNPQSSSVRVAIDITVRTWG